MRDRESGGGRATPNRTTRILAALAIGVASGLLVAWFYSERPGAWSDYDQFWVSGRALLAGNNPYDSVRGTRWPYPLLYPLPTVITLLPFTLLPLAAARVAFVSLSASLLAYALTARGWGALLTFGSYPFIYAMLVGQWSPLLSAAALLPALSWILVAKPNFGLAFSLAYFRRSIIIGGALLVLLSLAIRPSWPAEWMGAMAEAKGHLAPVTVMGGPVLLLALLKWRRPEARLLVAVACIPQTSFPYDAVPLFLVPHTAAEYAVLFLLSGVAFVVITALGPYDSLIARAVDWGAVSLALLYLPALIMVLRRPNEGDRYAWLERIVERVTRRGRRSAGGAAGSTGSVV